MHDFLKDLRKKVTVGLVGGSDLAKIKEQMNGEETFTNFDYVFAENGLVAYKGEELIGKTVRRDIVFEIRPKKKRCLIGVT